jgi:hypothetical protein
VPEATPGTTVPHQVRRSRRYQGTLGGTLGGTPGGTPAVHLVVHLAAHLAVTLVVHLVAPGGTPRCATRWQAHLRHRGTRRHIWWHTWRYTAPSRLPRYTGRRLAAHWWHTTPGTAAHLVVHSGGVNLVGTPPRCQFGGTLAHTLVALTCGTPGGTPGGTGGTTPGTPWRYTWRTPSTNLVVHLVHLWYTWWYTWWCPCTPVHLVLVLTLVKASSRLWKHLVVHFRSHRCTYGTLGGTRGAAGVNLW